MVISFFIVSAGYPRIILLLLVTSVVSPYCILVHIPPSEQPFPYRNDIYRAITIFHLPRLVVGQYETPSTWKNIGQLFQGVDFTVKGFLRLNHTI